MGGLLNNIDCDIGMGMFDIMGCAGNSWEWRRFAWMLCSCV